MRSAVREPAAEGAGPAARCPLGDAGDILRTEDGQRLAIGSVRLERLQDIGDEDLVREGGMWRETAPPGSVETDRSGFARWWDQVHARPEARWQANPLVWVINFERRGSMYVIRDIFQCKPGKARPLADMLKRTIPSMETEDGFRNVRVMVDAVAGYWTVVLEAEVESLGAFESHLAGFSARPDVREAMKGYMDLVDGGRREIYRLV